jgi:NADH-quinone oxidoreductase subunit A
MEAFTAWPLALYFTATVALIAVLLGLSWLLGERHTAPATAEAYESGMPPTGDARVKLSPQFYLVAMFFVIFDLEVAFVVAWAVAARDVGWPGFVEISIFVAVLLIGLAWLWRIGALDWGSTSRLRQFMGLDETS